MRRLSYPLIVGLILGSAGLLNPQTFGYSASLAATNASNAVAADDDLREAFEPIKNRFRMLFRSLDAQGGIAEENIPAIENVRQQAREFNQQHPDYTPALATELQLSVWLEDHDRVNVLYESLLRANPTRVEYARAWMQYVDEHVGEEGVQQIILSVLHNYPQQIDAVMLRLRQIKQRNEYARVIEMLEPLDLDPAFHARAIVLLAECYYAENRFEDALAALNRFDDATLDDDPRLRGQIVHHREQYTMLLELWEQEQAHRAREASADDLPRVRLATDRGEIILELFEDNAPNTVANFITLVEDGFYDGTRYHRVRPNFMAQGGDPYSHPIYDQPVGDGGPGYTIPDEHYRDDARMHFAGSLSMANTGSPNSGGSQFFITHEPAEHLNGLHTVFGRVLEGLDVVRALQENDELIAADVIRKRDHDYEFETIPQEDEGPDPQDFELFEPDDDEEIGMPDLPFND